MDKKALYIMGAILVLGAVVFVSGQFQFGGVSEPKAADPGVENPGAQCTSELRSQCEELKITWNQLDAECAQNPSACSDQRAKSLEFKALACTVKCDVRLF